MFCCSSNRFISFPQRISDGIDARRDTSVNGLVWTWRIVWARMYLYVSGRECSLKYRYVTHTHTLFICVRLYIFENSEWHKKGRQEKKNRTPLSTVSTAYLFATVGTLPRLLIPRGYRSTTVLPLLPEYVNLLCRRGRSAYTRAKYPVRRWTELSTNSARRMWNIWIFQKFSSPLSSATGRPICSLSERTYKWAAERRRRRRWRLMSYGDKKRREDFVVEFGLPLNSGLRLEIISES